MKDRKKELNKELHKELYFNKYEFEQAKKVAGINPEAGIEAYKNYIEKYPKDYSCYPYYISLLIMLNHLDEAEKLLETIRSLYFTEKIYQKNEDKARIQSYNIHFCTLKLLAYQNKIQELLNYYDNHYEEVKNIGEEVKFYYETLLGKKHSGIRESNSYLYRQMIEYQESDFRTHVRKHTADYNKNDSNVSKSFFSHDFPIDEVIEEVKKYIPSDKKLNTGFIQNVYVFKYDECGRDNNKLVDYFVVVVFNNTCKFITMCPSNDYINCPYTDLNYMKEKKEVKAKVLNGLERFNQRYKRNV